MSALLCASACVAASSDGKSALCQRFSGNFARGFGGCTASVALASFDFCEFDERSVPQRRAGYFSLASI